ncbi:hypothetical protein E2C01_035164 [Portunus trituberculatus]|uniref:Uncharacterized protein n=1 Tax=Portunus trituberculatus TaxID=210409 RepID=A0A5B7FAQ2_PORTR|nr:hypothetical protein [Portunus trituberculatus]
MRRAHLPLIGPQVHPDAQAVKNSGAESTLSLAGTQTEAMTTPPPSWPPLHPEATWTLTAMPCVPGHVQNSSFTLKSRTETYISPGQISESR